MTLRVIMAMKRPNLNTTADTAKDLSSAVDLPKKSELKKRSSKPIKILEISTDEYDAG